MRDDVCIILNERNTLHAQLAQRLEESLLSRHLSVYRIEPCEGISAILRARAPRVIVLDYLLGTLCTALDLLTELVPQLDSKFIVWTDEPNVSVAVSAMKMGAADYIPMSGVGTAERVASLAAELASARTFSPPEQLSPRDETLPFVGVDTSLREQFLLAEAALTKREPIIIVHGPAGAGRSRFALEVHRQRRIPAAFTDLSLALFDRSLPELFGTTGQTAANSFLSLASTLSLDHLECNSEEPLQLIVEFRERLWPSSITREQPLLIAGTDQREVALCWARTLAAPLIDLPALADRPLDFLPLLDAVVRHCRSFFRRTTIRPSPDLIAEVRSWKWPGNVKQFVASAVEALCLSDTPSSAEALPHSNDLSAPEQAFLHKLLFAKTRWESASREGSATMDGTRFLDAFLQQRGRLTFAAAQLGVSIPALRTFLVQQVTDRNVEEDAHE